MSHSLNNYIVVDSADRANPTITTSSDYLYNLPSSIRNASLIQLMTLQLYRADTNVNDGNCSFSVTIGGVTSMATMVEGEIATGSALATLLQTALIAVNANFLVTYNSTTNKLTITNPSSFSIILRSCSTGRVLGLLGNGDRGTGLITSILVNSLYTIVSSRYIDLQGEQYVLMYVNDYDRNTGTSSIIQTSFYVIPLENKAWNNRFVICNDEKDSKGVYYLTGKQKRIDNLRIRFLRPDGSLYNFHGTDNLITFKVVKEDSKDYLN